MASVGHKVAKGVEQNDQQVQSTTHLREKAGEMMHSIQEVGTEARKAAQEKLGDLRDTAGQYIDQGRARVRDFSDTLEMQIRDQPLRSVLIATGIGFVLGFLWSRRK